MRCSGSWHDPLNGATEGNANSFVLETCVDCGCFVGVLRKLVGMMAFISGEIISAAGDRKQALLSPALFLVQAVLLRVRQHVLWQDTVEI